jgi:hypothetical protein
VGAHTTSVAIPVFHVATARWPLEITFPLVGPWRTPGNKTPAQPLAPPSAEHGTFGRMLDVRSPTVEGRSPAGGAPDAIVSAPNGIRGVRSLSGVVQRGNGGAFCLTREAGDLDDGGRCGNGAARSAIDGEKSGTHTVFDFIEAVNGLWLKGGVPLVVATAFVRDPPGKLSR